MTELFHGIRSQLTALLDGLDPQDLATMSLGLSHSLSRCVQVVLPKHVLCSYQRNRFKLKFSPDKVDTMIVQAIALLDDLDKEINIYAMRVKVSMKRVHAIDVAEFQTFARWQEWYGWHFPELAKIIVDNIAYAKVVKTMGQSGRPFSLEYPLI